MVPPTSQDRICQRNPLWTFRVLRQGTQLPPLRCGRIPTARVNQIQATLANPFRSNEEKWVAWKTFSMYWYMYTWYVLYCFFGCFFDWYVYLITQNWDFFVQKFLTLRTVYFDVCWFMILIFWLHLRVFDKMSVAGWKSFVIFKYKYMVGTNPTPTIPTQWFSKHVNTAPPVLIIFWARFILWRSIWTFAKCRGSPMFGSWEPLN